MMTSKDLVENGKLPACHESFSVTSKKMGSSGQPRANTVSISLEKGMLPPDTRHFL